MNNSPAVRFCSATGRVAVLLVSLTALSQLTAYPQQAADLQALARDVVYGNIEAKREALYQIRVIGSAEAAKLAVSALSDPSDIVRATAASSVAAAPDAASLLVPLLQDRSDFVRREAAAALGETGGRQAAEALAATLQNDGDRETRAAAAASLGRIGGTEQITALAGILRRKPKDADRFIRRSAARAIGQIAQSARPSGRQTVTPLDFLPPGSRPSAAVAPILPDPLRRELTNLLSTVLQNPKEAEDTRREAAFALGEVGDGEAIRHLESCGRSKDYYLAEICREALDSAETRETK